MFKTLKKIIEVSKTYVDQPKSNIDLAAELRNTNYYYPENCSKKAREIISKSPTRNDLLLYVIELCKEYDTPQSRYIIATTYPQLPVKYRPQVIESINNYLNNELYYESFEDSQYMRFNKFTTPEETRNIHISNMLLDLGKAYYGLKMFDDAEKCHKEGMKLDPDAPMHYSQFIRILEKQKRYDDLNELKSFIINSKMYKNKKDDTFRFVLNNSLGIEQ